MVDTTARVRAPELTGAGGWLNTPGPLSLAALRGKVVLLDFWTFCCANCLHVLDELRALEEELADVLVVVGVHSPKFAHEADHDAVVAAVERYDVRHPVLDDPDLAMWRQYAVRAWPTLVLIDPEGYVVAQASGEGHAAGLAEVVRDVAAAHEAKGTLRRGPAPVAIAEPAPTPLRFPAKAVPTPRGLLVSDTGHHQVVLLDAAFEEVRRYDGFAEPQGLCLLPDGRVAVADTVAHLVRALDLDTGEVTTLAGTGAQLRAAPFGGPALEQPLSSPWDVAWYDGRLFVAMAGIHQLWAYDGETVGAVAGTAAEGLRDGPADRAYLAQPSGLAVGADRLWFVDAETSALRWYRDGEVGTVVGHGLFDFGHVDGPAADALLQHPLGVLARADGTVVVCDTYNGALRAYDPATGTVSTLATGLGEPSAAVEVGGEVVVVESAAHRVTRPLMAAERVDAGARRTQRPATDLRPGAVTLTVVFEPPKGQHLDSSGGPATRLAVSASPPELLADGAGTGTGLTRELRVADGLDGGVLHVTAWAATCDDEVEHPACHLTTQDWGIPVRLVPDADARLELVLRGVDA
ncbi:MAG TPA: thioredoxin-like domain-containing protein [Mycobacteriales bacterium]|jgi:thiol-disulfide isomerase/thioredoxin|nr:thioredoxin-like domain-containing protein [Mycobacteriales bacterium]